MQVSVHPGLIERLVHYACSMHVDQLAAGGNYALVSPSISICLLNRLLFRDSVQAHHRFQMLDKQETISVKTRDKLMCDQREKASA